MRGSDWEQPSGLRDSEQQLIVRQSVELVLLLLRQLRDLVDPHWLRRIKLLGRREEVRRAVAARKERRRQVDSVQNERTKLVACLAAANILADQRLHRAFGEMPAVRAGQRRIFDDRKLRLRIAHAEPAPR